MVILDAMPRVNSGWQKYRGGKNIRAVHGSAGASGKGNGEYRSQDD
jgi:hypothetical protein